jgi:hypothetical protein
MKRILNISILFSSLLLCVLLIGHFKNEIYYVIEGSSDRFPNIEKGKSKIHSSITPKVDGLVYSVVFYKIRKGLKIDTISILAHNQNKYLQHKKNNFITDISPNTTVRGFTRIFNYNKDSVAGNFYFELFLKYSEDGKTHTIAMNKPIVRKSHYKIYFGDIHDPTRIIIPFLTSVLFICILLRSFMWIIKRKKQA